VGLYSPRNKKKITSISSYGKREEGLKSYKHGREKKEKVRDAGFPIRRRDNFARSRTKQNFLFYHDEEEE